MRVLFVTDLHGSRWKYDRLLEAAKGFQADVVINGGDMLPWNDDPFRQGKFITGYLDNHFERCNAAGIYYLCYLGNDDLKIFDQLFEETCNKYPFVFCLAQKKFEAGGYEFVGMNWVVDTPFRLKDRCRMDTDNYILQPQLGTGVLSTPHGWQEIEDWFSHARKLPTIQDELKRLVGPKDLEKSVYVIHAPPSGLKLDRVGRAGDGVGSRAIYEFLKRTQPKLSLHGHIHESPEVSGRWYEKLGKTICIQPGQLSDFTYVRIDLSTMEIERVKEPNDGKIRD